MVNYNIGDCFVGAFLHTKKLLFKKFDLKTYIFVLPLMILSFCVYGVDYKYYMGIFGKMPFDEGIKNLLLPIFKVLLSPQNIIITEIIIALLILLAVIFIFYLGFTFRLIFFDFNIFKRKYDLKEYWNRNKDKSQNILKYFFKQLIYLFLLGCFAVIGSNIVHPYLGNFKNHELYLVLTILIFIASIFIIYIFIKNFAIFCIAGIFILPLYPRFEKDIKFEDTLKNFYAETKGKFWQSLLFFIVFGVVNSVFSYCFLPFILLFRAITNSLSLSLLTSTFYPIFITILIFYLIFIIIVNIPVAVYLNSFYQLACSLLCPEHSILLPVKNDQGKVVDTMTYFEHLESKSEN